MSAETRDHADRSRADVRMMAEALTLVDVGKVDLDGRQLGRVQSVEQGHRRMGVGTGIYDDAGIGLARRLDTVDEHAFVVALGKLHREAEALGLDAAHGFDVRQGFAAVDLGLTLAQHVEVWPVEHQHRLGGRWAPGGLCGQSCLPDLPEAGVIAWGVGPTRQAQGPLLNSLAWANSLSHKLLRT